MSSNLDKDVEKVDLPSKGNLQDASSYAVEGGKTVDLLSPDELDPIWTAKAHVLNEAMQDIGMGTYHWKLFVVAGFGWLVDNMFPVVVGLIFTPVLYELKPKYGPLLTLAQNIGLLFGAFFFSLSSDVIGRRVGFNITLAIAGLWSMVSASSPNFPAMAVFTAFWSCGVGGNLPIDSAQFLEFIPASHQYLLTVLCIFWAFGQLLADLLAWAIIPNNSCASADFCPRPSNKGWRYFVAVMGGITLLMWFVRFFLFKMHESPKFLMSRGRDAQAVEVIHEVAKANGKTSALTTEDLTNIGEFGADTTGVAHDTSAKGAVLAKLKKFDAKHVKILFATKRVAYSTTLIIVIWAVIGLAFPLYNAFLPYYLRTRIKSSDNSVSRSYRDNVIIAALGIPGALIGGLAVTLPYVGRKGGLAVSSILSGVFIMLGTTAKTQNTFLAWNCLFNLFSSMMYGILYALTPETFPSIARGTGNGLAASANRIFGIMAPIVAIYGDLTTTKPIYAAGSLLVFAGVLAILLPFEPRGHASL